MKYFEGWNNFKKIIKIKFTNKIIEWLIFRYFSIRDFEIPEYQSFHIWSFKILYPTRLDDFERANVERPIFCNLKTSNVKIYERSSYSIFLFTKLFLYFFFNYLNTQIFLSILTFQFFIIFQIWYFLILVYND